MLSVPAGELHALIGPNGAGKTTLIGQLTGEIAPERRHHPFCRQRHHRAADLPALAARARAFVPDHARCFRDFTALDNVALAVQAHAGHSFHSGSDARSEAELREPARAALDRVGLVASRRHAVVAARATASSGSSKSRWRSPPRPRMLLLDEPMAGMGPEESARMVKPLLELKRQYTILLVEHDMDAVFALADRISVLVYGRVIATGSPDEIRANAEVRQAYLGEQEAVHG